MERRARQYMIFGVIFFIAGLLLMLAAFGVGAYLAVLRHS
jgi:hypothetical protein